MTAIKGTNISDNIVPFDTLDIYPTHQALYGKGGWRSVATIVERDAIPTERLEEGCIVVVTQDNMAYQYVGGAFVQFSIDAPSYVLTETIACFFPDVPPVNTVLVWTAGVNVLFQGGFTGLGNIGSPPTSSFAINILNSNSIIVGQIIVNSFGEFTFTTYVPNYNGTDYLIEAGDYLKFIINTNNIGAKDISYTMTGTRTRLTL